MRKKQSMYWEMFTYAAREASETRSITPTDTTGMSRDRLFTLHRCIMWRFHSSSQSFFDWKM